MKCVYRIRGGKLIQEVFRKGCPFVYVTTTLIEKLGNLGGADLEQINKDIASMVGSEASCQMIAVVMNNNRLTVCPGHEPDIKVPLKMVRRLRG